MGRELRKPSSRTLCDLWRSGYSYETLSFQLWVEGVEEEFFDRTGQGFSETPQELPLWDFWKEGMPADQVAFECVKLIAEEVGVPSEWDLEAPQPALFPIALKFTFPEEAPDD